MQFRSRTVTLLSAVAIATLTGCPEEPATPHSGAPGGASGAPASGGAAAAEFSCKGKPEVGKPASTFSLPSITGTGKVAIEPGKVTLVDFWATWCGPCQKSFPKYQELYVKYKASGLEIAAVSVDGDDQKKDIPGFAKEHGAKFPIGWDDAHKIADCYKPPKMPSAFVVDKKGIVRFVHEGYGGDADAKKLEDAIKSLL
jgi:cytochrome c biogenesis protein CcmG, thiol:disulfide interchange protein DsbE